MAVRQVLAAKPAAGQDWAFTVPAQWLPYLFGVTAVLTTSSPVTAFPDETGNGHTATITALGTTRLGVQGPWSAGANNYAVFHAIDSDPLNVNLATAPSSAAFGPANVTIDGWWQCLESPFNTPMGDFFGYVTPPSVQDWSAYAQRSSAGTVDMGFQHSGSGTTVRAGFMTTLTWHHVAWVWDGATWTVYRDGVSIFSTATKPWPDSGASPQFELPGDHGVGRWLGYCAGVSVYPTALAAGNIAAHAAASGSWSAYRTAVLADTPTALWGLNTIPSGPSRIVTLKVTDGTRLVAQFPANFAAATADSFTWSWQALGPGAQSSTDGRINSVPIPEVRVDAGYVISSSTLDLAGTDQWGPITLWFDDGTGPAGVPSGTMPDTYLDALLVPPDWSPGP